MSAAAASAATHEISFHEVRREGRPLLTLKTIATGSSTVVEAEVYTLAEGGGAEPLRRPFPFASPTQASRFVDEVLSSLEYLGCVVV